MFSERSKIKKYRLSDFVLHPFFLAALPCIAAMTDLKDRVLPEEGILTILVFETIALFVFLICWLFKKNAIKAGILCSALIAYTFSYGSLQLMIDHIWAPVNGNYVPSAIVLAVYIILGLVILPLFNRNNWELHLGNHKIILDPLAFNLSFNIVTFLLISCNLAPYIAYHYQQSKLEKYFLQEMQKPFQNVKLDPNVPKPDIYYILLDGFTDNETLKRLWGIDDHWFVDNLRNRGFYIVPRANSNYDRTEFSISSSLNMQYINSVPEKMGQEWYEISFFSSLIYRNSLVRLLKANGYKFINISCSLNEYIDYADENVRSSWFPLFLIAAAGHTPLLSIDYYFPVLREMITYCRLAPGNVLPEVVQKSGPKFVLLYTDLSHSPCYIDASGKAGPLPKIRYSAAWAFWGSPQNYFAQWQYTGKIALKWIDIILSKPGPKPIIVIQADHGPGIILPDPNDYNTYYEERMHILNAYYFPGHQGQGLYSSITPVNSFRVMLNDYFNAKLPLLPDKVYFPPWYSKPFFWNEMRSPNASTKPSWM